MNIGNEKPLVGIYRLVMKKDSDNFRKSSIQSIMNTIKEEDLEIVIYEPALKKRVSRLYGR